MVYVEYACWKHTRQDRRDKKDKRSLGVFTLGLQRSVDVSRSAPCDSGTRAVSAVIVTPHLNSHLLTSC